MKLRALASVVLVYAAVLSPALFVALVALIVWLAR